METKICTKCKRELPATAQYFYRNKNKKDGFEGRCKECQGRNFKEIMPEGYKQCTSCKRILPATTQYFYRNESGKYGLCGRCKECMGYNFTEKEEIQEGYKRCNKCKRVLPATSKYFYRNEGCKYGLVGTCKECRGKNFYEKEEIQEGYKRCSVCKRILPATNQYFYKDKRSKDGFISSCKECAGGDFKEKEKLPEGYRRCNTCKRVLPETEEFFYRYLDKKTNRYYFKHSCLECKNRMRIAWGKENRDKDRATARRYHSKHRDKLLEYDRERRKDPIIKERRSECNKAWREKSEELIRAYMHKYRIEHSKEFLEKQRKREEKKKSLLCDFTKEQWEKAKDFFNGECAYCGKKTERPDQDHVIPLSKGGPYTASNIIPACKFCNSSKHDRNMESWYRKQPFYSPEREQRIKDYLSHMATPR